MKIDRAFQNELLENLAAAYPDKLRKIFIHGEPKIDDEKKIANLLYLEEHGLVDAGLTQGLNGDYGHAGSKITAKGIDFLADDGGLSAILGTVTVKIHADTIKELLAAKIDASSLPKEEKSKFKKHLDTISTESLKVLTKSLLEQGLASVPNLMQWLHTVGFPSS
ncbi:hypothetical protein [Collimonas arenae]|uniref:hypothetical protein n=1 Tax=Collimonas arenae TaxID=279058 RepID=UPI00056EB5B0|nr:hypothetical protein [Collimonas arenae]